VTGTGDVDSGTTGAVIAPSIALSGTTVVFNAGGLTDADSLSVSSTATTSSTISAPLSTAGAEISSGAGADLLTGGAGADRFGFTGRVETITIATSGDVDAAETLTATINGVTTAASVLGATTTTAATNLAAAINATSATSFATATSAGAVVTVTYHQFFGVAGTVAETADADNDMTETVAATSAGDNAGNDTISGGTGADTILGGAGADDIRLGAADGAADVVIYVGNSDTQTGVVASGFTFTGDIIRNIGSTDVIDLSKFANVVVANATYTNGTTFATATANEVVVVTGSLNETTGVFTAGAASTTNNDYLIQWNGGATTTTVNTIALVDIVGTVSISALNELLTVTVS